MTEVTYTCERDGCDETWTGRRKKFCSRKCQEQALKSNRLSTSIRFDRKLQAEMEKWCAATGLPVNWLVNRLCAEGMKTIVAPESFTLSSPSTPESVEEPK